MRLLLVYVRHPLVLLHVLLDVFSLLITLRCYQWPRSRHVFLQAEAGRCSSWLLSPMPASLCALRAARLGCDSDLGPITRTARFRHFSSHSRSRDVTMTLTVCQLLCVTELSTRSPLLTSAQCLISPGQYQPVFATYSYLL